MARSSVSRRWQTVRVGVTCSNGHQIAAGGHAVFSRAGYRQSVYCEVCALRQLGMKPPNSSFGFHGTASVDVRGRQAGGDD